MKIALYIEDGLEQIVLTPQSSTEKAILGKLNDGTRELQILRGSFFKCRGGWMRYEFGSYNRGYGSQGDEDDSTMIVLNAPPKDPGGPSNASAPSEGNQ